MSFGVMFAAVKFGVSKALMWKVLKPGFVKAS